MSKLKFREVVEPRPVVEPDRLSRLAVAIAEVRFGQRQSPRTAKLLGSDIKKMAQKVIEEAAETAIDAVRGDKAAVVNESVDLLYNLTILWSAMDIDPEMVWAEMDRRETELGMVEKLPKLRHLAPEEGDHRPIQVDRP